MQTRFDLQPRLDGGMNVTTESIDAVRARQAKFRREMAQLEAQRAAMQEAAQAPGQQTLKSCDCEHCFAIDTAWDLLEKKLCPEGKAAAKRKFKVYPSAYANGWAVQYCKGKFRKKGGKKK